MKPSFEMSANTRLLRQRFAAVPIGDTITYKELSDTISSPVTGATAAVHSALRGLLRNERMVFANVRDVGYQRLADEGIVSAAGADVDGLRRRARRSVMKLTAVADFAKLKPKDQLSHTTKLAVFTAVAEVTSDRGIRKIEGIANGRASELPIADTLKAFL